MVGTPRDMTLIIAGFFAQNLPAKAVELMSNGFLLGWCQLQEFLKNWKPNFRSRRRTPTSREAVPYKTKRQKRTAALCVFASFDSCCGIDSEKDSNAIVSYVENQL